MPKVEAAAGAPLIHTWAVPPAGDAAGAKLRTHPRVRWFCRTYENTDAAHVLPASPSDVTGLTIAQRVARRLGEHAREQLALGASMASLGFFVQNFGAASGDVAGATPALFRSPDDAAGVAAAGDNYNAVFTEKARVGPLTVESHRTPCETAAAAHRDAIETDLQADELACFGWHFGDTEELGPEPWHLCKSGGGVWVANVADGRAGTEIICKAEHAVDYDPLGGATGLTLGDWVTAAEARTPGFAPDEDTAWNSAAHQASGTTAELLRLRRDASQSAYARLADVFLSDPFWADCVFGNYEMTGNDHAGFPAPRVPAGFAYGDHTVGYFGLGAHCPVLYAYNQSDGTLPDGGGAGTADMRRFHPSLRFGAGRTYDEVAMFGNARRQMASVVAGSAADRPIAAWVRGCDARTGTDRTPALVAADLAGMVRFCATYPTCLAVLVWTDDTDPDDVDWAATLAAVEAACPEWVWSGSGWEGA